MRRTVYRQAADVIGGAYRRYRRGRGILSVPSTQSQSIRSQAPAFVGRMAAAAVAGVAARRALTQTRRNGKQVPAGGGGESKSTFSLHRPLSKQSSLLKMVGKNTVARSSGSSHAATQGTQNCVTIAAYFDIQDIVACFSALGETTADYQAVKALFQSVDARSVITNAESTNAHFTIYDVLAKKNYGASNLSPSDVFTLGFNDANQGDAANYSVPGARPEANPRFMAAYKILQRTEIILGPGATHNHRVQYSPNRIVSKEEWTLMGSPSGGPIQGLSLYTFAVFHGTPVHDATTETSVTLGAAKLDIVVMDSHVWKQVQYAFPTNSLSTTLVTNLTGEQMADGAPADVPDIS